jgi:DNA invertase Pin-like site-specific DNA recombinase
MPTAVAYLRVSSKAQDLTMQRAAIERAAAARGDAITTWYAEKVSAKTIQRLELQRLRADARAGHIGRLYVFRLDRLARSGIRDMFEVVEELRAHGVQLVTVADGFDLDGPAAEVVLAVMAWAAKMERLAINERISHARERLRAQGKGWGRPCRLSPLERDRVLQLRQEGLSFRAIAKRIHVPTTTVIRAVRKSAAADGLGTHARSA